MRQTELIMGMPITIELVGGTVGAMHRAFEYFRAVDERFSTYKSTSEISQINRGEIEEKDYSDEMREIFALSEKTKQETNGYFDIKQPDGSLDPSGVVKGWAIKNAADVLRADGIENFYVEAGGDIQASGKNSEGGDWSVGIRNPFKQNEIVKVIYPKNSGVATSGSYVRGAHIYNPHAPGEELNDIVSLSVVGPDVLEADRFATAAFAMGKEGIQFVEQITGLEGYAIDKSGIATFTSGFTNYTRI